MRGARDRLKPVPATSIVVDPARAEIPGSSCHRVIRAVCGGAVWSGMWLLLCGV